MDQPAPLRLDVRTPSRAYPIVIGPGASRSLRPLLDEARCGTTRFVVSNQTVWGCWGTAFQEALPGAEAILRARRRAVQDAADRRPHLRQPVARRPPTGRRRIVTFGGGVVGDMAGFAAATYLRGIALAHVPTTLLAQVDAAVGGKVGVNLPGGKNLVGAFYQPWVVVVDPALLSTLHRREYRAGLYEVIKYGVVCDGDLFARLQTDLGPISKRQVAALTPVIADCCRIKAAIVADDEREAGPRRVLNFGHTVGHALEASTQYRRFLHGEAVAYGMLAAVRHRGRPRRVRAGRCRRAVAALIAQLGPLPPLSDLSAAAQLELMRRDKKVVEGRLHVVLPTGIGSATVVADVSEPELLAALRSLGLAE